MYTIRLCSSPCRTSSRTHDSIKHGKKLEHNTIYTHIKSTWVPTIGRRIPPTTADRPALRRTADRLMFWLRARRSCHILRLWNKMHHQICRSQNLQFTPHSTETRSNRKRDLATRGPRQEARCLGGTARSTSPCSEKKFSYEWDYIVVHEV